MTFCEVYFALLRLRLSLIMAIPRLIISVLIQKGPIESRWPSLCLIFYQLNIKIITFWSLY